MLLMLPEVEEVVDEFVVDFDIVNPHGELHIAGRVYVNYCCVRKSTAL